MGAAMPFVSAGLAAAGAVKQFSAADDIEASAGHIAVDSLYNQQLAEAETQREIEVLDWQAGRAIGEARARAGASGVLLEGSVGSHLDEMEDIHQQERAWLLRTGEARRRAIAHGAAAEERTVKASADATRSRAWSGLFSAGGNFAASQNFWLKGSTPAPAMGGGGRT